MAGMFGLLDSNADFVRDLPSEGVDWFEDDLSMRLVISDECCLS